MHQCVVYYWYTGGAWPLQTSLGSLVRFGQMWSDAVISHTVYGNARHTANTRTGLKNGSFWSALVTVK